MIHAMYDVPGKSSDGIEMFDASDEVYEYLLMSLCPVSLSKAGLSYNAESNCIQDRIRDWIVDMPDKDFCSLPLMTEARIYIVCYIIRRNQKIYSPE